MAAAGQSTFDTKREIGSFLGGLSVSRKLAMALSLFLMPLVFVTVNLTSEQQKAIEFAELERDGLFYLTPVIEAEQALRDLHAGASTRTQLGAHTADISDAQSRYGRVLGVSEAYERARDRLIAAERDDAHLSEGIAAAEQDLGLLRRDVGDKSNLILDPDLDSYYSMDALVTKLAAVQNSLRDLDIVMRESRADGDISSIDANRIATTATLFRSARAELDFSLDAGMRGARDERLRHAISAQQTRSRTLGEFFVREVERTSRDPLRGSTDLSAARTDASASLHLLGQSVSVELDRLLQERITRFEGARASILTIAALLFVGALAITIFLMRQGVVRPISLLTRAIDCLAAGRYDQAVPLQERRDEIGQISRALEILRNVAQAKIEADAARSAADSANKAKSQFIANMSHELRTPLNAIIGYTEIVLEDLQEDGASERHSKDLLRVTASARHLLALIDGILDLAKVEAGREEISASEFDPAALVLDTIALAKPLAEKNGNELAWRNDGIVGTIRSDERRLKQCLLNLISNACKFTENGSVEISARKHVQEEVELITFEVKDTGIGMSADQLSRVFKPFQQADSSIAGRYGGTGLGLSITQEFARLLGGDVRIDSAPGQGTSAILTVQAQFKAVASSAIIPSDDGESGKTELLAA